MTANSATSKVFFDILESAMEARAHWQAWWALANQARPELVSRMNRFPDFFLTTERAHFNCIFINLAHLFDKRRDVSTIERYLTQSQHLYSADELADVRERLKKHEQAKAGVLEIRNNVIAHKNAGLTERQVFEKAKIRPRMIGDLVNELAAVVNFFAERENWSNRIFVSDRVAEATLGVVRSIRTP